MKVLIYDSDKNSAELIRKSTKELFMELRCNLELSTYTAADKIIDNLTKNPYQYDILILEENEYNTAFSIASIVRKENLLSSIAFHSKNYGKLNSALLYRPSAYLLKPLNIEELHHGLMFMYEEQHRIDPYFKIKSKNRIEKIPYNKIEFFESYQRTVSLYEAHNSSKHTFWGKLDDVHNLLPKNRFIRCHQSYIINIDNVKILDKTDKRFIMKSGRKVDISKRNYANVVNFFG